MSDKRFVVYPSISSSTCFMVEDSTLSRFVCYCDTKADAVTICEALNAQEVKVLEQMELPIDKDKQ